MNSYALSPKMIILNNSCFIIENSTTTRAIDFLYTIQRSGDHHSQFIRKESIGGEEQK